jgi:hypothetical protein
MEELVALKKSKECKGIEQELKALRKILKGYSPPL